MILSFCVQPKPLLPGWDGGALGVAARPTLGYAVHHLPRYTDAAMDTVPSWAAAAKQLQTRRPLYERTEPDAEEDAEGEGWGDARPAPIYVKWVRSALRLVPLTLCYVNHMCSHTSSWPLPPVPWAPVQLRWSVTAESA